MDTVAGIRALESGRVSASVRTAVDGTNDLECIIRKAVWAVQNQGTGQETDTGICKNDCERHHRTGICHKPAEISAGGDGRAIRRADQ